MRNWLHDQERVRPQRNLAPFPRPSTDTVDREILRTSELVTQIEGQCREIMGAEAAVSSFKATETQADLFLFLTPLFFPTLNLCFCPSIFDIRVSSSVSRSRTSVTESVGTWFGSSRRARTKWGSCASLSRAQRVLTELDQELIQACSAGAHRFNAALSCECMARRRKIAALDCTALID